MSDLKAKIINVKLVQHGKKNKNYDLFNGLGRIPKTIRFYIDKLLSISYLRPKSDSIKSKAAAFGV